MLRRSLLMLSRSDGVKHLVSEMPVSSGIVARFVAGETVEEAVDSTQTWSTTALSVTLDYLGEDTLDRGQAHATVDAYVELLKHLADAGLTQGAEVSVKLSAVGQALPGDGERIALDNARAICQAASNAGTTVTLDMEDHTTTDSTLRHPARAASGLPDDRRRAAGLPAPHRGRLPRPRDGRLAGAAVQGRLQGAGVRRLPGQAPGQPVVRPLPQGADGGRRATRWSPRTTRG